ncbi:MAG TPA: type I restriction enzyme HsdR N-terminal domain-containing protein [Flavobacteriales bacterium]|jgi:hypothetical protein|nr:type I restriction enzyme HsdR N-terminal domain-containing protein [Flavobacteriales bacterium]
MQVLNFPKYDFKIKKENDKWFIWDIVRQKYYILTPEEWVRQHVLHFLIKDKHYSKSLIAVEKQLLINQTKRRFDIVVFNKAMQPEILVECKAPQIAITQKTFDQTNQYNWLLKAPYLLMTNGLQHVICKVDFQAYKVQFLKEIPAAK